MKTREFQALKVVDRTNTDCVIVADDQILVLAENPTAGRAVGRLIHSLSGRRKRDWFTRHFYFCLPLVAANQLGFVVTLESDISVRWTGGDRATDLKLTRQTNTPGDVQNVHSHFGCGIITIDHPWVLRTPKGVNLFVGSPPNYPIDGLCWMSALVETDQLRTDFTFNLKVTRIGETIVLRAGSPIGYFLPIPRHFSDRYVVDVHPEGEVLERERKAMKDFQALRRQVLGNRPGLHYREGVDVYGTPFRDHQKR